MAILTHMIHRLRQHLRTISAALVAVVAGLWLVGACAAVWVPCATPCSDNDMSAMAAPCERAGASCELPSPQGLLSGAFDLAATPFVAAAVWPEIAAVIIVHVLPENWQASRPPSAPLYLTHLALLN